LTYAITKKNQHISRINISGIYKILINSPMVHFGIKTQHAYVDNKNLIIFIYKKSFGQILHKKKIIYIKIFTT
jgi:hypothetical protein